jgi:hypothetical protein
LEKSKDERLGKNNYYRKKQYSGSGQYLAEEERCIYKAGRRRNVIE